MILGVIERLKQLRKNKLVCVFIRNISNEALINMVLPKLPLKSDEMVTLANYLEKISQETGKPLSEVLLSDEFFEIVEEISGIFQTADLDRPSDSIVGADAKIYSGE